jgi:hypothetical protein
VFDSANNLYPNLIFKYKAGGVFPNEARVSKLSHDLLENFKNEPQRAPLHDRLFKNLQKGIFCFMFSLKQS